MNPTERRLAQEVKAMTRLEVLKKALEGRITWQQAADIYRCLQQGTGGARHDSEAPSPTRPGLARPPPEDLPGTGTSRSEPLFF